jgi:hypothetical protein
MIERIEKSLIDLKKQNQDMESLIKLTLTRLAERESFLGDLILSIDEIEKQPSLEKKQNAAKKNYKKIGVLEGNLKSTNRNLDTCRRALEKTQKDMRSTLKEFDLNEISDLIADKKKKEGVKGKDSKGLKELEKSWAKFADELTKSMKLWKNANKELNKEQIPELPNLPSAIPVQYLV